jgi:hypothetical protein
MRLAHAARTVRAAPCELSTIKSARLPFLRLWSCLASRAANFHPVIPLVWPDRRRRPILAFYRNRRFSDGAAPVPTALVRCREMAARASFAKDVTGQGGRLVKRLSVGAITPTICLVASIAIGAEGDSPAWKKPAPGTHAFLGDDGGGVDTATVCGTADHFRDWLRREHPGDCQTFQYGLSSKSSPTTL